MGKIWATCGNDDPACGNGGNGSCSVEDVMASHLNTGSKRTYAFMQKMFYYEPVGVFEDFVRIITYASIIKNVVLLSSTLPLLY